MNIEFIYESDAKYISNSQKARRLTEHWMSDNMYCPRCGNPKLEKFRNNKPVADFYCPSCCNQYELKSKIGNFGRKVPDGAYKTMIERITEDNNPDFFFMKYSLEDMCVTDLFLIPKYFFYPDIIEKRNPLSPTSRRSGWIGCNIIIEDVPSQGKINIISDSVIRDKEQVLRETNLGTRLEIKNINQRGWLFDIVNCINKLPEKRFTISDIYQFETILSKKHPNNNNIKPKIRQQLQILRDKGLIEFLGDGKYLKI